MAHFWRKSTYVSVAMSNIVREKREGVLLGAHVFELLRIGASHSVWQLEPEAIALRSGSNIIREGVGRVCYPECGRLIITLFTISSVVRNYTRCRHITRQGPEIAVKDVAFLISILCHEAVSKCVVGHISVNNEVVRSVNDNATLIRRPNQVLGYNRASHITAHMEVNRLKSLREIEVE